MPDDFPNLPDGGTDIPGATVPYDPSAPVPDDCVEPDFDPAYVEQADRLAQDAMVRDDTDEQGVQRDAGGPQ